MGLKELLGFGSVNKQIPLGQPAQRNNNAQFFNGVFSVARNNPVWLNVSNQLKIAEIYDTNPVLNAVVTLGANYMGNARVKIRDVKTGEIITQDSLSANTGIRDKEIVAKAFRIIDNPNPMMSRWEFLQSYIATKWVFGNAFFYGNAGGVEVNIKNIETLWNVWPQYMSAVLTGSYFSATTQEEIIQEWIWGTNGFNNETKWKPQEILHRKDKNLSINCQKDIVFGKSRVESLMRPLSNISLAYESENNVMADRGARLIITAGKDDAGVVPIMPNDKKKLKEEFRNYGLQDGQSQALIAEGVVNITAVDQDIRKLGIFETIATDALAVANTFNTPYELVRYNLTGSTFENQNQAEKRMYQNVIIPEFTDLLSDLTNWLKLRDFGYEYVADFSHIAVLQEDAKDKAQANRQTSAYYKELFLSNGCTLNEWRQAIGLNSSDGYGDKRLSEMDDKEVAIILNRNISGD
jgi:phage portal protein BeeE